MRQQLVKSMARVRVNARQHVAQVGPRIQAIEFGRLHQAHHHRRALPGQLAAHEQPVLGAKLPRLDLPLDQVVVDGDRAVVKVRLPLKTGVLNPC